MKGNDRVEGQCPIADCKAEMAKASAVNTLPTVGGLSTEGK
jgi:hypothetical protein